LQIVLTDVAGRIAAVSTVGFMIQIHSPAAKVVGESSLALIAEGDRVALYEAMRRQLLPLPQLSEFTVAVPDFVPTDVTFRSCERLRLKLIALDARRRRPLGRNDLEPRACARIPGQRHRFCRLDYHRHRPQRGRGGFVVIATLEVELKLSVAGCEFALCQPDQKFAACLDGRKLRLKRQRRANAWPAPVGASIRWRRSLRPAGGTPRR
jgi:hypothetical protein